MPESRHVLFLQSSSEGYGSGKIILQVLEIYKRQGLIPVVLLTNTGPLATMLSERGFVIRIKNLGILRRKYVNLAGLFNRLVKNIKVYRYLSQLHSEFQFELVYSNTLAVIVGAYWAKQNKIPHIWHIHEILPGPTLLVRLLAKMLDFSTPEPIAVSQAVADHWKSWLKTSRPVVIHNGISYTEYLQSYPAAKTALGIPEEKVVITMIGRINPGKGQLFFLEMAKEIMKSYPNAYFLLVGDPFPGYESIAEEILTKMREVELRDAVHYLGFRTDIPEILFATDVFVLPSILPDSFPTVILEAMASGKPVIATDSGGASEMVIHEETGLIISIGNVKKGAEALDRMIKNVDLRIQMGNKGRERVLHEYSLKSFEEKITNHLWRHLRKS